ncbi:probable RNA-binding protein 18 isoform X2 [Engraulis encrasicolus]|uniref:probable RNA-binding protein 18 isoform X2 n=1 Tax=Engraulis encrasicolus TaxID=184585 RepID=UPI002FD0A35F
MPPSCRTAWPTRDTVCGLETSTPKSQSVDTCFQPYKRMSVKQLKSSPERERKREREGGRERELLTIPVTDIISRCACHSVCKSRYHLVKLLEKFGKVKQFDFLFHKSGPLEGQPRGYCFVNFHTKEEAERAIQCLNGKLALSKKLVVRWAHAQRFEPNRGDKNLPSSLEPSCSVIEDASLSTNHLSTNAKIRAIEAKLQMMEENPEEDYAGPSPYLYNKPPETNTKKRPQPYVKPHRKFRR